MGSLSLSMEIELGWGRITEPPEQRLDVFSDRCRSLETKTLASVLEVCDRWEVPITFDVVGHLLLRSCEGQHPGPNEAWFDADPGTDAETDPLYYAPDLVERIANAAVDHELATHTFSHVPLDAVSKETIHWEVTTLQRLHEQAGLGRPTTLVPPMHRQPPTELLSDHGIDVIRMPDGTYPADGSLPRRFAWHFTRRPPRAAPERKNGLTRVSTTHSPSLTAMTLPMGQLSPHPSFHAIPKRIRKRIHWRYLAQAIDDARAGADVHLWTHLWDLSNADQWDLVEPFLEAVGRARQADEIDVRTLNEFAT